MAKTSQINRNKKREKLVAQFAVKRAALRLLPRQIHELQKFCDEMLAAIRSFRHSGAEQMEGAPLRRYLLADLAFHLLLDGHRRDVEGRRRCDCSQCGNLVVARAIL